MDELKINTGGFCFLCLNKAGKQLNKGDNPQVTIGHQSSPFCSLLQLSRYLKLNMGKVFYEEGPISQKLLNKVRRSTLKVELCEECAELNEKFSVVYRQLEKAEMRVASYLDKFHRRLSGTDRDSSPGFHSLLNGFLSGDELLPKLKIAEVLMKEAEEKCALKLKLFQPRVKLRKFKPSPKFAREAEKRRINLENSGQPNGNYLPSSEIKLDNIKLEGRSSHTIQDLDDENSFSGNDEPDNQDFDSVSNTDMESVDVGQNLLTAQSTSSVKSRSRIKVGTRSHACPICKMRFTRRDNMGTHYKAVHLQVKSYNCKLCGKKFNKTSNLNRHTQSMHRRVRFPCDRCDKSFNNKSNLKTHQLTLHFGKRVPCKLCKKTFCRTSVLKNHETSGKCPALQSS